MLEELREKISIKIQNNQNKKEELYEKISIIDSELLELNENMLKINTKDSFLDISPKEAFSLLDKLGYDDNEERLNNYLELIKSLELERDKNIISERHKIDY